MFIVKPKYKKDDIVFRMKNNQIVRFPIRDVTIEINTRDYAIPTDEVLTDSTKGVTILYNSGSFRDHELFPSEQILLNHLKAEKVVHL